MQFYAAYVLMLMFLWYCYKWESAKEFPYFRENLNKYTAAPYAIVTNLISRSLEDVRMLDRGAYKTNL